MKIKDVLYFLGLLYWKRIDLPCQWLGFRANVREIVLLTAIYRVVLQIVFFLCGNQQGWLVTQRLDTFMEWLLYLFCWKIVVVFILLSQSCKKRRIWIYAYIYIYMCINIYVQLCTYMYIIYIWKYLMMMQLVDWQLSNHKVYQKLTAEVSENQWASDFTMRRWWWPLLRFHQKKQVGERWLRDSLCSEKPSGL